MNKKKEKKKNPEKSLPKSIRTPLIHKGHREANPADVR